MSADESAWSVIDCPSCGARLKVTRGERRAMQCPKCREAIPAQVRGGAPERPDTIETEAALREKADERGFVHALPSGRNADAQPYRIRGREKEEWERRKSELKSPTFGSHVARIGEDVPHVEIVRKKKQSAIRMETPAWEEEANVHRRRTSRRIRRLIWSGVGVALAIAAFSGAWTFRAAFLGPGPSVPPGEVDPFPHGVPALFRSDDAVREFPTVGDADYGAAMAVLRRFFAATSLDELGPVIREADRLRPVMAAHYGREGYAPVRVRSFPKRGDMMAYKNIVLGIIELDQFRTHIVAVEKSPEGYLVDWESFVGWCEVPWAELAAVHPLEPVLLRAEISHDDYFNHDFADETRYACYRLSSFDHEHSLYGYVERRRALFTELESRTHLNPLVLATVRVRYPSESSPSNQVEITELVADGWVLPRQSTPLIPPE